jgi:DHA2 family multidrug resistance protein
LCAARHSGRHPLSPADIHYQETLRHVSEYFVRHGSGPADAQAQAFAWIASTIEQQAVVLSYIGVFWMLAVLSALAIPIAFILRPVELDSTSGRH